MMKAYFSNKSLENNGGWKLPDGRIATEFAKTETKSLWSDLVFLGNIDYKNTQMSWVAPTTEEGKKNYERKIRLSIIDSRAEEEHIWPYENRGSRF
jgi:hypothetical protein